MLYPLSYGGIAAGQGFEPQLPGPEPGVLPLHYPALAEELGLEPRLREPKSRGLPITLLLNSSYTVASITVYMWQTRDLHYSATGTVIHANRLPT